MLFFSKVPSYWAGFLNTRSVAMRASSAARAGSEVEDEASGGEAASETGISG